MTVSKVLILFNPISGRGKGEAVAAKLKSGLEARGLEVESRNSQDNPSVDWQSFDRVVVVGGDGTLRSLLFKIIEHDIPVCLYPCGNQSLFAKRFGYPKNINKFCDVVLNGGIEKHYVGLVNDDLFFFMVSVGFDGFIVGKVSEKRKGRISNWDYFIEIARNLITFRSPVIDVEVDGKPVVSGKRGYVIVANSCEYALGVRVIAEASSKNGCFDIRFIPCKTAIGFFYGILLWRRNKRTPLFKGQSVTIRSIVESSYFGQADGDTLRKTKLELRISPTSIAIVVNK